MDFPVSLKELFQVKMTASSWRVWITVLALHFVYEDAKPLVKHFFGAFGRKNFGRARVTFVSSVVAVKPFFEIT